MAWHGSKLTRPLPRQSLPKPLPSSPHPLVWLPVEKDLVGEKLEVMKSLLPPVSVLPPGYKRLVVVLKDGYTENVVKAAEAICNEGQRAMATYT